MCDKAKISVGSGLFLEPTLALSVRKTNDSSRDAASSITFANF